MLFRSHGFTDLLAIESGINYVKRKYQLTITDSSFSGSSSFRIIGYEIPVSFLVFIQLGEKLFMNVSLGQSIDMYASSVRTYAGYFQQVSFRNHIFGAAVLANLGWEWRTEKSGSIYLGASYHRPYEFTHLTKVQYKFQGKDETIANTLSGNYLTIDLRYFFHEDPMQKKRRTTE